MSSKKIHVVFMGTPEFAVPVLDILIKNPHVVVNAVVSMPARPAGRGKDIIDPPVARVAKELSITCHQPENLNRDEHFLKYVAENKPDIVIVLAFAQFLGSKILSWPRLGCFNIHTSILPRYRGASPIHHALLNGDKLTGSCLQKMVKELDAGDVYLEKDVAVDEQDNFLSLAQKLSIANQWLVDTFITYLVQDKLDSLPIRKQNGHFVSVAREIQKSEGQISFSSMSAEEIMRRMKAFQLWPGISIKAKSGTIKIHKAYVTQDQMRPGQLKVSNQRIFAGTTTSALEIVELQPENKKILSAKDFINGKKGQIPEHVEEL